jgi:hypothetical protein
VASDLGRVFWLRTRMINVTVVALIREEVLRILFSAQSDSQSFSDMLLSNPSRREGGVGLVRGCPSDGGPVAVTHLRGSCMAK